MGVDRDGSAPSRLRVAIHSRVMTQRIVIVGAGSQGMIVAASRVEWNETSAGGPSRGGFGSTG